MLLCWWFKPASLTLGPWQKAQTWTKLLFDWLSSASMCETLKDTAPTADWVTNYTHVSVNHWQRESVPPERPSEMNVISCWTSPVNHLANHLSLLLQLEMLWTKLILRRFAATMGPSTRGGTCLLQAAGMNFRKWKLEAWRLAQRCTAMNATGERRSASDWYCCQWRWPAALCSVALILFTVAGQWPLSSCELRDPGGRTGHAVKSPWT